MNDLFFTSRADVEEKEPPKKKALCSPLTNSEKDPEEVEEGAVEFGEVETPVVATDEILS